MRIATIAKPGSVLTCAIVDLNAIPRLGSVGERFLPNYKNGKKKR